MSFWNKVLPTAVRTALTASCPSAGFALAGQDLASLVIHKGKTSKHLLKEASHTVDDACCLWWNRVAQTDALLQSTRQRLCSRYDRELALIQDLNPARYQPQTLPQSPPALGIRVPDADVFDRYASDLLSGILGDGFSRIWAQDILEKARAFERQVYQRLPVLNQLNANLVFLNCLLDEEDALLDLIQETLERRSAFDHSQIREQLLALLSAQLFDSKMNVSSVYQTCLQQIRKSCEGF